MSGRDDFLKPPRQITVEKLTWRPDSACGPVLDHLDCILEEGCFYGIIGPNGSGKTSLIRHLLRLIRVEEGEVRIDGINISRFRRKELARLLSYVPQKIETGIRFTVEETVMMGRNPHIRTFGYPDRKDREEVIAAMKSTGIGDMAAKSMSVLSGGETQRVLLARSVAQGCPWLFLDEPVSNLDIYHQFMMMDMLRDLNRREGKTIVCVLHDINLASMYCDRILVIEKGQVAAMGETSDVLTPSLLEGVYGVSFRVAEASGEGTRMLVPIPGSARYRGEEHRGESLCGVPKNA